MPTKTIRAPAGSGACWVARPDFDAAMCEALRTPAPVPTTSIHSRSDGVVVWQTCVRRRASEAVEDIEIAGSHIGMGWNRDVLRILEDRLGQEPGRWQRFTGQGAQAQV